MLRKISTICLIAITFASSAVNVSELVKTRCNNSMQPEHCAARLLNSLSSLNEISSDDILTYLKELDKKKKIEFMAMEEIDTLVAEKIPKKECLAIWEEIYNHTKLLIGVQHTPKRRSTFDYGNGVICSFDGSKSDIYACVNKLDKISKETKAKCAAGKITRDVRKKKKSKRLQKPYQWIIGRLINEFRSRPWYAMDSLWISNVRFLEKYANTFNEESYVQDLLTETRNNPEISTLKYACTALSIKKRFKLQNFCNQIMERYPAFERESCHAGERSFFLKYP